MPWAQTGPGRLGVPQGEVDGIHMSDIVADDDGDFLIADTADV